MNHPTDRTTAKITIEGEADLVKAIAERLRQIFTVTYEGKNSHISLRGEASTQVRRYLRVLPQPPEAHHQ